MRKFVMLAIAVVILSGCTEGQTAASYMSNAKEALLPYHDLKTDHCQNALIQSSGPWADYALPDGVDPADHTKFTWSVVRVDVIRFCLDLTRLDEDKISNRPIFSLEYLGQHKPGTAYNPDTPAVTLFTKGLNDTIIVNTVDLAKVEQLRSSRGAEEKQMGISLDERKFAIFLFPDQQHADAFQHAIQKAIVACKAQVSEQSEKLDAPYRLPTTPR